MSGRGRHRAGPVGWEWSTWRLVVALAVLVALIGIVAIGTFTPHLRVCGAPGALEACRPLEWGDPLVVLGLILVGMIGFPDITWIEAGPDGVKLQREPGLPQTAALEKRVESLEQDRVPEWYRETRDGGGRDDDHQ